MTKVHHDILDRQLDFEDWESRLIRPLHNKGKFHYNRFRALWVKLGVLKLRGPSSFSAYILEKLIAYGVRQKKFIWSPTKEVYRILLCS